MLGLAGMCICAIIMTIALSLLVSPAMFSNGDNRSLILHNDFFLKGSQTFMFYIFFLKFTITTLIVAVKRTLLHFFSYLKQGVPRFE